MKILLIAIVFALGCKTSPQSKCDYSADSIRITERLNAYYDTILYEKENEIKLKDSIIAAKPQPRIENTISKKTLDSLTDELYSVKYKVERVRYYLNICLRKPSQDRFLKGWIKRAIQ
jgi:hypothetical protein